MWGGATFDTSMRFLKEDPWDRLAQLRERIPNILSRCCCAARNAVGYTNYPDNVVRDFVKEAADAGIDLFRIFDSLNWVPNMQRGDRGGARGGRCSARRPSATPATSSTRRATKYDLKYYVELAKELEKRGAHILGIKDMAGLASRTRPRVLVQGAARGGRHADPLPHPRHRRRRRPPRVLAAAEAGVDIADAAMASMSG